MKYMYCNYLKSDFKIAISIQFYVADVMKEKYNKTYVTYRYKFLDWKSLDDIFINLQK